MIAGVPPSPTMPPAQAQAAKVVKAAKDFEALLVGSLLRSFERTFSSLSGEDRQAGSDDYHYMADQALARSLADSGGLGIARMITCNLLKTEPMDNGSQDAKEAKVQPASADIGEEGVTTGRPSPRLAGPD
jgi:Rod binding domain-containing protein